MKSIEFIKKFPKANGAVIVLSGGMDSNIAARLAIEVFGKDQVHALSFFYKQKQSIELDYAKANAKNWGIKHTLVDIGFLGDMVMGVSANIQGGLPMPTIKEVLGDPAPPSEVPFRNGILLMIATAYAQANNLSLVVTGLQASDQYNYFDTTPAFVNAMNGVLGQNRLHDIKIYAPFINSNKADEITLLKELDDNIDLLANTITCYNPNGNVSCGICPSCSERIQNFARAGFVDPIEYAIEINWQKLIDKLGAKK